MKMIMNVRNQNILPFLAFLSSCLYGFPTTKLCSRIISVNRIVVDCPDQELQQDKQFSPSLSVVDAMTDLPINCVLLLKR